MTPIKECLINKSTKINPIWLMRQAEDIYLSLEKLENQIQTLSNYV